MCRGARSNQAPAATCAEPLSPEASPRHPVARPNAPTPEQTNHWLQGMDHTQGRRPDDRCHAEDVAATCTLRSPTPDSPNLRSDAIQRPRSPTPTKMLAWEEDHEGAAGVRGSPGGSDNEDRGIHADALISKLLEACQLNDIKKAFAVYDKLRRMRVQLYEGVYKTIIECCMRTQQLGHAMQFYETLKGSGQRISARLVTVLIEACAREQHGDKVHAIWNDWCPSGPPITAGQSEVLLVAVSALIRTMSPDLAREILADALQRSGDALLSLLPDAEVELDELLHLNEEVAEEARTNGTLMEELAGCFSELHALLDGLREQCLQDTTGRFGMHSRGGANELLMEDVDLDLELAARS